jgi:hypothetical protein
MERGFVGRYVDLREHNLYIIYLPCLNKIRTSQGIAKLMCVYFIDEARLLTEIKQFEHTLTARNSF